MATDRTALVVIYNVTLATSLSGILETSPFDEQAEHTPLLTGWVALPEPSTYSANTATLVDSARNVEGKMIGAVIRDDVAKIEMTWRYLTVAQWAAINRLFKENDDGQFINRVSFFDQSAGGFRERNMYVNDRKAGMWRRNPDTGEVMGWMDCKLNLIEV